MFENIPLLQNPLDSQKIIVIEGPDGTGKTTLVKELVKAFEQTDVELRTLRFPDNHGNATFRNVIMSEEMATHSGGQCFLFMADFLYTFESKIKPCLDDPKVKFLCDRFAPSTCVYQNVSLAYINALMSAGWPDFAAAFSKAQYLYLTPISLEAHKERLSKKHGDEINHLDPVGNEAIKQQTIAYLNFFRRHQEEGLFGSFDANLFVV